jgi:hypothetical protein
LAAALFLGLVWMGRRAPVARPPATVAKVAAQPRVAAVTVAEAPRLPRRGKRQRPNGALRQPSPEPQPFLTIPYTVPLAPEERTALVRMEIPVAALRAVGFNVAVSDSGSVVEADVLVSQDGRARAIRPLSISSLR